MGHLHPNQVSLTIAPKFGYLDWVSPETKWTLICPAFPVKIRRGGQELRFNVISEKTVCPWKSIQGVGAVLQGRTAVYVSAAMIF